MQLWPPRFGTTVFAIIKDSSIDMKIGRAS